MLAFRRRGVDGRRPQDDDESDYAPEDAGGFIRLHALRLKERARKQGYSA